jgi:chromosome segregation ATPase
MTGGKTSALQKQLQPVLDAQKNVADIEAKQSVISDKLDDLDTEEQRQRQNIQALRDTEKGSQKRFVDQLGKIEDQILSLQKQNEALDKQLETANQELSDRVDAVQFEQPLEP